ncbi:hypothetical protein D9758_004955 [Tetrapyrgos nigripes]|uniref:Uncharacterized protein n=1 Tax=Tetrapyrgos nigripes TaxID=182062 RepID=A0A8H5GW55_9AGAR|nr:hypothetical protein D9758_004955 [Tetrapyrgos nigripes]
MVLGLMYASIVTVLCLVPIVTSLQVQINSLPETITPGATGFVTWQADSVEDAIHWTLEFLQNDSPIGVLSLTWDLFKTIGTRPLTIPAVATPGIVQMIATGSGLGGEISSTVTAIPGSLLVQLPERTITPAIESTDNPSNGAGSTGTANIGTSTSEPQRPTRNDPQTSTSGFAPTAVPSRSNTDTTSGSLLQTTNPSMTSSSTTPLGSTNPSFTSSLSTSDTTVTSTQPSDASGAKTNRLAIILPSVIGASLFSIILILIFWRYRRRQRLKVQSSGNYDSESLPSRMLGPGDFKSISMNSPDIPEPFPGERGVMRGSDVRGGTSHFSEIMEPFSRLPWNRNGNTLAQPHPYELKPDYSEPIPSRQSVVSSVEAIFQPLSPLTLISNTRPRSHSEFSIIIRSPTQTESNVTSRQHRLQEEADQMRARLSALGRDPARSEVTQEDMGRIREQIERLEILVMSNWARGLTDEPPPMYHA